VSNDRDGVVTGLAVGLGVVGALWLLQMLLLVCLCRRLKAKGRRGDAVVSGDGVEGGRVAKSSSGGGDGGERFLVSDISEWLDKYRVFKVEELERGTGGFDDAHLINGSVYKANIDGEVFAVKKMKWDACEELKILQKVRPLSSPIESLAPALSQLGIKNCCRIKLLLTNRITQNREGLLVLIIDLAIRNFVSECGSMVNKGMGYICLFSSGD
jgi:hypothetical protein